MCHRRRGQIRTDYSFSSSSSSSCHQGLEPTSVILKQDISLSLSLPLYSLLCSFSRGNENVYGFWPEGLQEREAWVCCKSFSNSLCEDCRRRRRHETRIPRRKGIGGVGSKKTQVLKGEEPAIAPPLQKSKIRQCISQFI